MMQKWKFRQRLQYQFHGICQRENSVMNCEEYSKLKYKYRNREFWCRGDQTDTAGKNAQKIQEYIKRQIDEDKAGGELTMDNF